MVKPSNIDVIILCGGMGKRLRTIVSDVPKPMAKIGDRPFLEILLKYISGFGFKRFILSVGYMGNIIIDHFKNRKDITILFSDEEEPLGTAGAIKKADDLIKSDTFFVMNGDSFCNIDLNGFLDFHISRKALATIATVAPHKDTDYGIVSLDNKNRIISFEEKTSAHGGNYINAGSYIFNRNILGFIPEAKSYSLEYQLFPSLLDERVFGYVSKGTLIDIGVPDRYQEAANNRILKQI